MDSYSGCEPRKFIFVHLSDETTCQFTQTPTETGLVPPFDQLDSVVPPQPTASSRTNGQTQEWDKRAHELHHSPNPSLISRYFGSDSSDSNESCGTYITCKMRQIEEVASMEFTEVTDSHNRKV